MCCGSETQSFKAAYWPVQGVRFARFRVFSIHQTYAGSMQNVQQETKSHFGKRPLLGDENDQCVAAETVTEASCDSYVEETGEGDCP